MVNPAITNLAVTLGVMQLARKVDFDDPTTLFYVRVLYVTSNIIIALAYFYQYTRIQKQNDLTTLKYVEPAAPMSGKSEPSLVTTTVKEYDMLELQKGFKGALMGVAMMAVMHLYFKFSQPLLVQSILPVKNAFETKLASIHVFGKPATGDNKRPFKAAPGLFGGATGNADAQTDKASIEKLEQKASTAKKED
ncbi:phosphate transporter (Pho88) [Savitreella phatthalungensis]